ncbi:protein DEHYDRATION-INDUCED 19 2 isoform X3 [Cinnamomum micranthum f. kanehirae]|uniref:Protein DEHYDRATION-INDUCED 19 2 isoform X3 n=1 Tax=Cinnamomum micranthum f. kanehirae TaxID=337451 RepID=A0A443PV22_9MAGN|nr:protein DEHYDRATION-INDUCED 19 2 isoform X3 [Cinnamomum micranthum f. kanehirae]
MDSWSDFIASKRLQSALQSRSELYFGFEEIDGEDDDREEFPCPFCSEDFDIYGLCRHIDEEHRDDSKNGICPVCATGVGMDMRQRRLRKGSAGSHSTLSLLRKELEEEHLQSLFGGSRVVSSNTAPDMLLSSFMHSFSLADAQKNVEPHPLDEGSLAGKSLKKKAAESIEPSLSDKDQKEKAQRCEFVQQVLVSTFLDDIL